jgi:hypothetical protein
MWAVSFNLRKVCVGWLYALKMLGRLGQYNCQQHDDYKQERNNEKSIRLGAVSSALKVDNRRSTTSLPPPDQAVLPACRRSIACDRPCHCSRPESFVAVNVRFCEGFRMPALR